MSFWDPGRAGPSTAMASAASNKRQCTAERSSHNPGGDPSRDEMMQGDAVRGKGLIPHRQPAAPVARSEWEPDLWGESSSSSYDNGGLGNYGDSGSWRQHPLGGSAALPFSSMDEHELLDQPFGSAELNSGSWQRQLGSVGSVTWQGNSNVDTFGSISQDAEAIPHEQAVQPRDQAFAAATAPAHDFPQVTWTKTPRDKSPSLSTFQTSAAAHPLPPTLQPRQPSGASTRSAATRRVRQPSTEYRASQNASSTTKVAREGDQDGGHSLSASRPLLHGVHMNKNCHFCEHSPKRSAIFTCTTQTCGQMFCQKCLTQHLKMATGFTSQADASATGWKCPLCLRLCCCLQQLCSKKHLHCKRHRRQLKQHTRKGSRG